MEQKTTPKRVIAGIVLLLIAAFFVAGICFGLKDDAAYIFSGETVDLNRALAQGHKLEEYKDCYVTYKTENVLGIYGARDHKLLILRIIPIKTGTDNYHALYVPETNEIVTFIVKNEEIRTDDALLVGKLGKNATDAQDMLKKETVSIFTADTSDLAIDTTVTRGSTLGTYAGVLVIAALFAFWGISKFKPKELVSKPFNSLIFVQSDFDAAVETIKRLTSQSEGLHLEDISYAGDMESRGLAGKLRLAPEQVMVLKTDFQTDKDARINGLRPGFTYKNYKWNLIRENSQSPWRYHSSGY